MGELTYKARRLESEIARNMQHPAERILKPWHLQNEGSAQERNGGRRAFLGKVINSAVDNA